MLYCNTNFGTLDDMKVKCTTCECETIKNKVRKITADQSDVPVSISSDNLTFLALEL